MPQSRFYSGHGPGVGEETIKSRSLYAGRDPDGGGQAESEKAEARAGENVGRKATAHDLQNDMGEKSQMSLARKILYYSMLHA